MPPINLLFRCCPDEHFWPPGVWMTAKARTEWQRTMFKQTEKYTKVQLTLASAHRPGQSSHRPYMWSEQQKKRLKKWSLDQSEENVIWKGTHSCHVSQRVNQSEQSLNPVSDQRKHQYGRLIVLKLKGNCCAKPPMLRLPFNQTRMADLQMLMTPAKHDLSRTNALALNNLLLVEETEHFCQIWSSPAPYVTGLFRHIAKLKDCH